MNPNSLNSKSVLSKNGKSFYWASLFLGSNTALDASNLYYFCRKLDDLADKNNKNNTKKLKKFRNDLIVNQKIKNNFFKIFKKTKDKYNIKNEYIVDLLNGLIFDQGLVKINDQKDLIQYCYKVAGCVGLMMCPILGCNNSKAKPFAIDLGIAMQITNIARDIKEDAEMNRRYIPGDWINNLSASEIIKASKDSNSKNYILIQTGLKKLLNLAEIYYKSGNSGLVFLPLRSHISISIASYVYRKIGQKIINDNYHWGKKRVYTTVIEKVFCSLISLKSIFSRMKTLPTHDSKLQQFLKTQIYD